MEQQKYTLYVDLDGVLADYEKAYRELGGDPDEKGGKKANRFKAAPHFYLHLDLMPGAMELWNFLKPHDPHILSAQSNYLKSSGEDKHAWVEKHLHMSGPKVVIVKYPQDKQKHCRPGDILIDDSTKNCSEWINAGGIAIIHHNTAETIRKLTEILRETGTQHVQEAFQEIAERPGTPNLVETFEQHLDRLCFCGEFPIPATECASCMMTGNA